MIFAGSNANNLQDSENSMGNVQDSASTTGESRIPRPSHLAEVLQSTRQLLIGEVADCLTVCSFTFASYILFEKATCVFALTVLTNAEIITSISGTQINF